MGYIYLITNKVNNKKYIGQTICNDINKRWGQYKKLEKQCIGRCLYNSLIKYGIEKFKFQIICICFDEDCNKLEKEYIKKYNTISPNGYNLMEGGKNSKQHPETINLRVQKLKGRKYGPPSKETKEKISQANKGVNNPNYNKKMSDEQKKKISDTHKELWKLKNINKEEKNYESTIIQLNALKEEREKNKKKVGKYDKNNNLLEEFNSISEASKKYNISHSTISKVCLGKPSYKTAAGFNWKYL